MLYLRGVFQNSCTVEPVSSGDPVLFQNPQFFPLNDCIKRSRLLSGRGHPLLSTVGIVLHRNQSNETTNNLSSKT